MIVHDKPIDKTGVVKSITGVQWSTFDHIRCKLKLEQSVDLDEHWFTLFKQQYGFGHRTFWNNNTQTYEVALDFFDSKKMTWFILKYGDILYGNN